MSKNIMERFWSTDQETSAALHTAMKEAINTIIEYFKSPHAAKENLIKTDMKVANTVLSTFARMRQAESGELQALTILGERADKSAGFREFIQENLPQIEMMKKLPTGRS